MHAQGILECVEQADGQKNRWDSYGFDLSAVYALRIVAACHAVTLEQLLSPLTLTSSLVSHGCIETLCIDLTQWAVGCGAVTLKQTKTAPTASSHDASYQ